MNKTMMALLVSLAVPAVAHADVANYQPYEDACNGQMDGGTCTVNQGEEIGMFEDGGSGTCAGGGSCSAALPYAPFPDGGFMQSDSDAGVFCVPNEPGKCFQDSTCLICVVAGSANSSGSTSGTTSTSGTNGTTAGGTSGTTTGSSGGTSGTGSTAAGSTGGTSPGGTAGKIGTSGKSGGGCTSAGAIAPWFLALLVPLLVRRKRKA